LWTPRCRKPLSVKCSTRYAVLKRVGEPVDEDQEVLFRTNDVALNLIIKVTEPITLDCADRATTFGIQIDPVDERDCIADLARVCWRDDLIAVTPPLGGGTGCHPIGREVDGRAGHASLPNIQMLGR